MEINQGWLALIGALLGGSGLKIIEYWLNRSKEKDDSASQFRNELRQDVQSLRDELHRAEVDRDSWRDKYYELVEDTIEDKKTARRRKAADEADKLTNKPTS